VILGLPESGRDETTRLTRNRMANIARQHFRPELLPAPRNFYEREFGRLSRPSRGWASCKCPFHESGGGRRKRSRSFAVNLGTGAFNCFHCGAKGDLIKFVMLRDGLDFKAAAQVLGAWDESPSPETLRKVAERERERQAEELRRAEERRRRLELCGHLHAAISLEREISNQLDALHRAGGDEDPCWELLSLLLDYERECDRQYCRFAGLECSQ